MAYLTTTILQNESAWYYTAWQPVIADTTDYATWLGTIVTRAAKQVEWRMGAAAYAAATALEQAVLQEAELCLAQYYMCLASAVLADTSDTIEQNPNLGGGRELVGDAKAYLERYETIMASFANQRGRPRGSRPAAAATSSSTTEEIVPAMEEETQWEASLL